MKNQIYHVIEAAIRNQVIIQPLDEAVTEDDIRQTIRWVMRDNPDIFWFSHQYEYYSKEAVVRFQYTFSPERVVRIRESIDDVVKNDFCLDEVCRLSPREQVAYVYKWLVTYCSYNVNSAYNQTIYSVLVRRNSVCTGYARTAQYLFGLLGLESRLVFGRLHHDSEEGRHCWNMVRLEGEYYHFDACLADSSLESVVRNAGLQDLYQVDGINYNFLCVSTPEILLTRTIEDPEALPECPESLDKDSIRQLAALSVGRREEVGHSCIEDGCSSDFITVDYGSSACCTAKGENAPDKKRPSLIAPEEESNVKRVDYGALQETVQCGSTCFSSEHAAVDGVTYFPRYDFCRNSGEFIKKKENLLSEIQLLKQKKSETESLYKAEKARMEEEIAKEKADSQPPSATLMPSRGKLIGSILSFFVPACMMRNTDLSNDNEDRHKLEELQTGLLALKEKYKALQDEIQSQIDDCQHQMAAIEEQEQYTEVYSSVFAPAEVKRRSYLIVQVYLHLYEESEEVKVMASETDRNAERRDYNALDMKLKPGDKVDVAFSVHGETGLICDRKSVVWNGSFRKCTFNYFVPEELDVEELRCELKYYVNGTLIGDSQFTTQIVAETPRELHTEVTSEKYHKIFISYAHLDFDKVKFMAAAYRAQGVDYFFDRDYLKAGDIYPEKIREYINTCDLFVLCWSSNAAKSEYVQLEKAQALPLAKNTDQKHGTLTIRPLSLRPRAALPDDMKDTYNFEKI